MKVVVLGYVEAWYCDEDVYLQQSQNNGTRVLQSPWLRSLFGLGFDRTALPPWLIFFMWCDPLSCRLGILVQRQRNIFDQGHP